MKKSSCPTIGKLKPAKCSDVIKSHTIDKIQMKDGKFYTDDSYVGDIIYSDDAMIQVKTMTGQILTVTFNQQPS